MPERNGKPTTPLEITQGGGVLAVRRFTEATAFVTVAAACGARNPRDFFLAFYDNGHTIPFMTLVVHGSRHA